MSNDKRPSRPASRRQEQEYETRRGESASRSGAGRPASGNRPASGSRPASGNRPTSGSRPASGNRPASGSRPPARPPVKRPVKRKKRRLPILPVLFLAAVIVIVILIFKSCGGKDPASAGQYTLEFTPSQALIVGDTGQVTILGLPEDFNGNIRWSSSKSSVLEIDNGVMKAKTPGESLVAAIIDGETYSGTVVVYAIPENISAVTINHNGVMIPSGTVLSGKTLQLEAVITLDDGSDPMGLPVNWTSNNVAVAVVSVDGLVTARDVGSAAITAKVGNQSAVCVITVQKSGEGEPVQSNEGYGDPNQSGEAENPGETPTETPAQTTPPVTTPPTVTPPPAGTGNNNNANTNTNGNGASVSSLILSQNIANLDVGGSLVLGVTVSPSNASVSWNSSNPSVATVSPDGVVTAVGEGDVVITAAAGSLSSHCSIRVDLPVDPNAQNGSGGQIPNPGHV